VVLAQAEGLVCTRCEVRVATKLRVPAVCVVTDTVRCAPAGVCGTAGLGGARDFACPCRVSRSSFLLAKPQ